MLYREVYYDLSVCYELSRWVDNLKIVNYAFMVILSFFWGMYFDILARMLIFWFIFWRISKIWSSNGHLWSISRPNNSSYLRLPSWPPTFICRTLSDLVERWDFLLLGFKYLFWNDGKSPCLLHKWKSWLFLLIYVRLTIVWKKIAHVYLYIRKRTLDRSLSDTHK